MAEARDLLAVLVLVVATTGMEYSPWPAFKAAEPIPCGVLVVILYQQQPTLNMIDALRGAVPACLS